ncbi:unnamed protein product, partial [Symbiodinium pilosum]
ALSGDSTDCNCSKTSWSSSQGGSRSETAQIRARSAGRSAGCSVTGASWRIDVLAAACGKSGTAAFRSRTPRFQARRDTSQAARTPLREVNINARCEALYLEGRCRQLRHEQRTTGKEQTPPQPMSREPEQKAKPSKAWAEEVLRRHQQKLRQREEERRCKAERREEEDLKECSFAPKLVSRNHLQLQVNKARRHLQNLAEQQQAVLLRLDVLQDGDGKVCVASRLQWPSASTKQSRSLLLEELARIDDEAHCIIRGLVELGVPKVLEEPDPSTICSEYDSGLLRRMQMEDAWGFKELTPIRTAGPLPPAPSWSHGEIRDSLHPVHSIS